MSCMPSNSNISDVASEELAKMKAKELKLILAERKLKASSEKKA